MYDSILVPTDGSEQADRAFEQAVELARTFDAELHVLHVVDQRAMATELEASTVTERLERRGTDLTEELADRAESAGIEAVKTAVVHGVPHRVVLDYADEADLDLVVMGTHGRTGLDRYLLGSVTEKVVRLSDVPVLTVGADGE